MESTIVRENLMTEENYAPYCGNYNCKLGMPRATWFKKIEQFICGCGWTSEFPKDFIERYKNKWKSLTIFL